MRLFLFIFIFILAISSTAQINIGVLYNSTGIGRNISLIIKKDWGRHSIIGGVKYHINRDPTDNQNHVFFKRFYAKNFSEHWGYNISYNLKFSSINNEIDQLIFYDFNLANTSIRSKGFLSGRVIGGPSGIIDDSRVLNKTTAIEHNIGYGLIIPIGAKFLFYERIGGGVSLFYNLDQVLRKNFEWEFGYLLSLGVLYKIN